MMIPKQEVAFLALGFVSFFSRLTCLLACDRTIRLTAERGKLMNQANYSSSLGRSTSCIWEIEAPIGHRIEVIIHVFQMTGPCCSCEKGYVEFRDGLNASSPLIGRYCAKKKPIKVYSSYNSLRVRFFSVAKLEHAEDQSSLNKFRASYCTICGEFVRASSGVISSPGYPNYSSNVTCLYTVVVPFGWVKLSFTDFAGKAVVKGQCKFDFIELIEMTNVKFKNTIYGPEPLCGQLKSTYVFSRGQQLSLLYNFYQSSGRFAAKFEATTAVAPCGGMLMYAGYVYSYNYPYKYPSNTECHWKLGVLPHQYIKLTFLRFNFTCADGKVEIYDGWSVNSFRIIDYCGNQHEGNWIKSRSEKLLIKTKSRENVAETSTFVLSFTAVDEGLCNAEQFTCISRECANKDDVCDGVKDCADGSDELQNCPKKKSKSLYALWIIFGLAVVVILGFWMRRIWRTTMIRHTLHQRGEGHISARDCDNADEMPCQNDAPPTYNEGLGPASISPPSYQETLLEDVAQVVLLQNNTVQFFPAHSDNPNQHLLPEHEPQTSNDAPYSARVV